MFSSIGFIGTGTMGTAVARAAVKGAQGAPVLLANRTRSKAEAVARELGVQTADNETVARECSLIFLGVKPQMMEQLLSFAKENVGWADPSIMQTYYSAGTLIALVVTALLTRKIKDVRFIVAYPVICLMPNTPVAVGAGVVQYYGVDATEEELSDFQNLLSAAGMIDRVNPDRLNAASAVSGCGPAFCAVFIEALADGGVACGLPRDKALAYAAKMVEGTAQLMLENHAHPGQLKDGVCSPGGTTIQGVRTLEDRGFRSAVIEAVIAAYEKTIALGK